MGKLFYQYQEAFCELLNEKNIRIDSAEQIDKVIQKSLPETSKILFERLIKDSGEMLQEHSYIRSEFEARLNRRWMKPLNLLEMLIVMNTEVGEEFAQQFEDTNWDSHKFNVLYRIHTRACQISYEILALLRSGFPDGAFARWRTLHELAVLAFFIFDHDETLALKYLEYEAIENYREMEEYQKKCRRLGFEPLSKKEVSGIKRERERLIVKYGEEFAKEYGWTSEILPKWKRSFKGMEEKVNLQHLHPFYKMACNQIHSGPKGNSMSLALMGEKDRTNFFLSGASNYGLADPGQNTAISLIQIATCLTMLNPTIDKMMIIKTMEIVGEKISHQFVDVQMEIEEEEAKEQNGSVTV
nr:DUF5677 domain-containing protein [uncultured Niameybacter sp.]